jgi:hypothetical protein
VTRPRCPHEAPCPAHHRASYDSTHRTNRNHSQSFASISEAVPDVGAARCLSSAWFLEHPRLRPLVYVGRRALCDVYANLSGVGSILSDLAARRSRRAVSGVGLRVIASGPRMWRQTGSFCCHVLVNGDLRRLNTSNRGVYHPQQATATEHDPSPTRLLVADTSCSNVEHPRCLPLGSL